MADEVHTGTASFAFGTVSGEGLGPAEHDKGRFRIALMGDFSGRAAAERWRSA